MLLCAVTGPYTHYPHYPNPPPEVTGSAYARHEQRYQKGTRIAQGLPEEFPRLLRAHLDGKLHLTGRFAAVSSRRPKIHAHAPEAALRRQKCPKKVSNKPATDPRTAQKAQRGFRSDLRHLSRIFTRFLYSQRRFPFIAPKGFLPYQADPLQKRGFSRGPQTETKKRPKIDPKMYKKTSQKRAPKEH